MKIVKKIISLLLAVLIAASLCGCNKDVPENKVHSVSDVNGSIVGVMAGSAALESVEIHSKAAEIKLYYSTDDLADALKSGEVDCVVADGETKDKVVKKSRRLTVLEEPFSDQGFRIAIPKGNAYLCETVQEAAVSCRMDGTQERIVSGWTKKDKSVYTPKVLPEDAQTILVAVCPGPEPYTFYDSADRLVGLEIDIIRAVCDKIGVKVEFVEVDQSDLIFMAESGKVSLAIGRISESDSDAVDYTDTYLTAEQYVIVRE